jgi:hypothetical protein
MTGTVIGIVDETVAIDFGGEEFDFVTVGGMVLKPNLLQEYNRQQIG